MTKRSPSKRSTLQGTNSRQVTQRAQCAFEVLGQERERALLHEPGVAPSSRYRIYVGSKRRGEPAREYGFKA